MIIKPWSAILCLLFSHIVFECLFFSKSLLLAERAEVGGGNESKSLERCWCFLLLTWHDRWNP